jgi:regulatory protein
MIIKSITKGKTSYLLYLDNGQTVKVSEDSIVKYRLLVGRDISEIEADLAKELEFEKLYKQVVRFASYGKSSFQIESYLYEKGIDDVLPIITRLKKEHLIDDFRLLKKLQQQNYSKAELEFKLKHYEFKSDAISHLLGIYDEEKALYYMLIKAKNKYKNDPKKKEKIYRFLLSKGFPDYLVNQYMNIE